MPLVSLNFGQFLPLTTEFAALECLKNQCIIMWPLLSSVFIFVWIFLILAGNKYMHKRLGEFVF